MNQSSDNQIDPDLIEVWIILSDLFLDTDIELFKESMATRLSKTKFSSSELDQILKNDVAPCLGTNLLSVAGVWSGFSEKELVEAILELKAGSKKKPAFSWLGLSLSLGDWQDVLKRVEEKRAS